MTPTTTLLALMGHLLRVSGAAEDATFVAPARMVRGTELPIDEEAGYLLVRHRPGTVIGWIETDRTLSTDAPPVEPDLPARPSLCGRAARFRLQTAKAVVLHLRTTTPVATLLSDGISFHPVGAMVDALVPRGTSEVEIRAIRGRECSRGSR